MATEFDATAYAARLGVTPTQYPTLWECGCNYDLYCDPAECATPRLRLPDPRSDDLEACLWEPFLMRALGWPEIFRASNSYYLKASYNFKKGVMEYTDTNPTPTAALAAAFDAKEATCSQPKP